MSHARLDHRVFHSVAGQGDELLGPHFLQIGDFSCRHYYGANNGKLVILHEVVLLQAEAGKNLCVVSEELSSCRRGRAVGSVSVLDLVGGEQDALAHKVL